MATAAQGTAVAVAMDMTEGIIARFRTMAIFRPPILTGHVAGSVIQAMLGVAIVTAVAVLVGFRSQASVLKWLAAAGLLTLLALAGHTSPHEMATSTLSFEGGLVVLTKRLPSR